VKNRTGDQRGGSEWETIKILLEIDGHSNKMNSVGYPKSHAPHTTFVCQNHVATGVLLVLGTNTTCNHNFYTHMTVENNSETVWPAGAI
jgi:hypothetical protein